MKVAFVHYHLNPGGVTTVIRQQIAVLKKDCDVMVITGAPPAEEFPVKTVVIPEIGYARPGKKQPAPEKTAQKIARAITDHWPSGCDILHIHNPLLAKNSDFQKVLGALQDLDFRLLLQVHDFAEDGRPGAYFRDDPYPANCHYCVINQRDYNALIKSGLKPSGLHLLPNTIMPFDLSQAKKIDTNFILYPVRAIRRKNIGEAILLSLFFPDKHMLAITLPPNSDRDRLAYQGWKNFASRHYLQIMFEASQRDPFPDLVKTAERMITTSISEGFGFSFLEPWTAGKNLSGRLIPEICADFTKKGLLLDHMYNRMAVPLRWIDDRGFYSRWASCIRENAKIFDIELPNHEIDTAFQRMTRDRQIDFAFLDENFQQQILLKIFSGKQFKNHVKQINPFLTQFQNNSDKEAKIYHNQGIVASQFGKTPYRQKLLETYRKTIDCPVQHETGHKIDKKKLARIFLQPDRFSLLKWSPVKSKGTA
jgi:hypothetical protein